MPEFAYVARDLSGKKISGTLEAATQHEALAALDAKALFPVSVQADKAAASRRGKKIKPQVVATAYGQLADLLRSGVPLLRALEVLKRQSTSPAMSDVASDIRDQVQEGRTLAEAMARHPKVFNEMAVSMVRAGSEGGFLEEALDRIGQFSEQQQDLKGRVVGALAYPLFLLGIGALVVTGLLVFVVPKFEPLFARMRKKGELPVITDWLLDFSALLQNWWFVVVGVIVFIFLLVKVRLSTDEGQAWVDRVKLKFPLAGNIFLNFAVARFCRVLGTLLKNGVPILKSLDISSDAAGNRVLRDAIRDASENISSGESLAAPLTASGKFPPAVVEMISVAEESNTLDTVLVDVADGLERRTWRQLDLLVRLLEPIFLLLVAAVVLLLAIALLIPVIKMSSAI